MVRNEKKTMNINKNETVIQMIRKKDIPVDFLVYVLQLLLVVRLVFSDVPRQHVKPKQQHHANNLRGRIV